MEIGDITFWIEEHPLASVGIAVGVSGIVLLLIRGQRKQAESDQELPAIPVGRLLDAYPPTVQMLGSPTQVITVPRSGDAIGTPTERRFVGVPGLSCPRGSRLVKKSDGSWGCVSDRTGREVPMRMRTDSGWKPVSIREPSTSAPPPTVAGSRAVPGMQNVYCPRGSRLVASGSTYQCISERTGNVVPMRKRTESGWQTI